MTNPKLQTSTKSKILNSKPWILKFRYWSLFVIWCLVLVVYPSVVLADHGGLVPCHGIDCSLCGFFELFVNIFDYVALMVPVLGAGLVAYGGYLYIISRDNPGALTKAKSVLLNTVIGIAIFYASYVLASSLVTIVAVRGGAESLGFENGTFRFACSAEGITNTMDKLLEKGIILNLTDGAIRLEEEGGITSSKVIQEGDYTRAEGVSTGGLTSGVKAGLNAAAVRLRDEGIIIVVTSGYRDVNVQRATAIAHCTADSIEAGACVALPGKSVACIPDDSVGGRNCPHTTRQAIDVNGVNAGNEGCVQGTRVVDEPCQNAVITAMKAQGFCVLRSPDEPWHFEKPKVSVGCE